MAMEKQCAKAFYDLHTALSRAACVHAEWAATEPLTLLTLSALAVSETELQTAALRFAWHALTHCSSCGAQRPVLPAPSTVKTVEEALPGICDRCLTEVSW